MDKNGYLVNSANEALNGWPVDPATGVVNQNTLAPIQVTQTVYNPVATSTRDVVGQPAGHARRSTRDCATPISSDIDVYDALGTVHTVTLNWRAAATPANNWTVDDRNAGRHEPTPTSVPAECHIRRSRAATRCRPARSAPSDHRRPAASPSSRRRMIRQYRRSAVMLTLHRRLRLRRADHPAEPRHLRPDRRRHAICRHAVQSARPDPERRAARRFLERHHPGERQHRGELRQRPVPHRSRRCR